MPRSGVYQGPRSTNNVWSNRNLGEVPTNSSAGSNNKYYGDHDDRSDRTQQKGNNGARDKDNRRRVSFKPSTAGPSGHNVRLTIGNNRRTAEMAIRARLAEDEDMGGGAGGSADGAGGERGDNFQVARNGKRMRRRGSPIPKSGHGPPGQKKLIAGSLGWFLVTIPYGHKHDKQVIFKQLHQLVQPLVFIPHYFKVELTAITFYVDDIRVAEALLNADRKMALPDGHRMLIRVRNGVPQVSIDASVQEKMKLAMAQRYNATTKALDLSKFHASPELHDAFCALFRPTIMMVAIQLIADNIPDLEALKLDDNKIHLVDHFKCFPQKLPFLKILHLANNKITTTHALEALKECHIVDLVLDGNPVKERARDHATYVREIRKKFPKLQRLDNEDLPPHIGFDLSDEGNLPLAKASFLCSQEREQFVRDFLVVYFNFFDTDRQQLLNAYHEHAMFSMTAAYTNQPNLRLNSFLPFNRNILRNHSTEYKHKLLKHGRLPVVSFLSELPDTQHDLLSFAVDLTLYTPQLIMLIVTGVFKEKEKDKAGMLRSFQKSLTIVPQGEGFCIKNELMHVANCTIHQIKAAFKAPAAEAPPPAAAVAATTVAVAVLPDATTQMQMVQAMALHSNMNLEWSKKCLEGTNWDFNLAGQTFTELHKLNKIPPEAFVK